MQKHVGIRMADEMHVHIQFQPTQNQRTASFDSMRIHPKSNSETG
jgi:hypothetical protein